MVEQRTGQARLGDRGAPGPPRHLRHRRRSRQAAAEARGVDWRRVLVASRDGLRHVSRRLRARHHARPRSWERRASAALSAAFSSTKVLNSSSATTCSVSPSSKQIGHPSPEPPHSSHRRPIRTSSTSRSFPSGPGSRNPSVVGFAHTTEGCRHHPQAVAARWASNCVMSPGLIDRRPEHALRPADRVPAHFALFSEAT